MNTNQKAVFLGSGRKRSDSWLTISVCLSDAEQFANEFKGKKYLSLNVNIKSTPDQYGKDVQVTLDQYKKDEKKSPGMSQPAKIVIPSNDFNINEGEDDLPF